MIQQEGGAHPSEFAEKVDEPEAFDSIPLKKAFRNSIYSRRLSPRHSQVDLQRFLRLLSKTVAAELKKALAQHRGVKAWAKIEVVYKKDREADPVTGFLSTRASVLLSDADIEETISKFNLEFQKANANFCREGSGLVIVGIEN